MIVGRNTDYLGQGRWMKYQTLFFYSPINQHRYVKVSSAGLLKSNSAMNEKGMVVGGHLMSFTGSTPAGVSFTIFENEIMRKAASLEQAEKILKDSKRGGSFGLTVADSRQGTGKVFEATSEHLGERKMNNGLLYLTNNSTTPELRPVDLMIRHNLGMRDSYGRFQRFEELLVNNYGAINPEISAAIMGDHFDYSASVERGVGNIIGSHLNVTSVIFKPEQGRFWVAGRSQEPSCLYEYKGFDFFEELKLNNADNDISTDISSLPQYKWTDPNNRKGFELFMEAFVLYSENPRRIFPIRYKLQEAAKIDRDEPAYKRILAELYINNLSFTKAQSLLVEAVRLPQSNNERAILILYMGLVHDFFDQREKALMQYQKILQMVQDHGFDPIEGINAQVYKLAAEGVEKPYTIFDLDQIGVSFTLNSNLD
jgi:tetratricopeptide (TPR) repeat protein